MKLWIIQFINKKDKKDGKAFYVSVGLPAVLLIFNVHDLFKNINLVQKLPPALALPHRRFFHHALLLPNISNNKIFPKIINFFSL